MKRVGVGTFTTTNRMRELVNEALDNNRLSYGPMCQKFEREFAKLHGCRFAVTSSSGTASLRVALQTLKELHGWRDGAEVIIPAVTFVATVNVVLQCGLKPVLVDVERDYYGIDSDKIADVVTNKSRAIIPVHLFGMPSNPDIFPRSGTLKTIEDSCECMFADAAYRVVGSQSDIAAFSTYVAHLISTGVGGISTTNNPDYAAKMRSLVNHGRDGIYIKPEDSDVTNDELKEVVSRRFRFESVGWSARMTEMQAALGLAQLETWEDMIAKRRSNAEWLTAHLKPYEDRLQLPAVRPGATHSWMMYPLVLRDEPKWGLVNWLEARGIETREMLPLTNQPVYAGLWNEDDYPVAKWINESGWYVGCHQDLEQRDLDRIVEAIGEYFKCH
jgi:dTDP-4-amino-4,6-dideoxygalactose transaminase